MTTQNMAALALGNQIRLDRARLKREVAPLGYWRGRKALADLIENPPEQMWTMRMFDALLWVKRLGEHGATNLLLEVGITNIDTRIEVVTMVQCRRLAMSLRGTGTILRSAA